MTELAVNADRLLRLTEAVCDTDASQDDLAELDTLLLADDKACCRYLNYCELHFALRFELRAHRAVQAVHGQIGIRSIAAEPSVLGDDAAVETPVSTTPAFLPVPPYGTTNFFADSWPVAYSLAAVILGLGMVTAAVTHVSQPVHVASALPTVQNSRSVPKTNMPGVGKITGMVDCKIGDSRVSLGQKIDLVSGLMEITYDTGAKVILQGPVTYSIDRNGGYLAVGKLTGKLERKTSDPFCICTPTARVTDLGTEFGVEVNEKGGTTSHVFRGAVEVLPTGMGNNPHRPLRVGANESVCVDPTSDGTGLKVRRIAVIHSAFVCQMPEPLPRVLLRDTFDSQEFSTAFAPGDYGLNGCLAARQSGLYEHIYYISGGVCGQNPCRAQVNHTACPGKLCFFMSHGDAGWVELNCNFPRNLLVSVELDPDVMRCLSNGALLKTVKDDRSSKSWMALGVLGRSARFDRNELPRASDAGAVLLVQSNGQWKYHENGIQIADGRVPSARPYRVTMRVLGRELDIQLNGTALMLGPNRSGTVRMLTGLAANTGDHFVSIGAGNVDIGAGSQDALDLSSADNLTVTEARRGETRSKGTTP